MKNISKLFAIILFLVTCIFQSCKKDDILEAIPTISTSDINNIRMTSVVCGGKITNSGGCKILERGLCWGTYSNPTIDGNITNDGTGSGAFTSIITSLLPNTLYYVRAYATNKEGTAYGNENSFTLFLNNPGPTVIDADNNAYHSVKIGTQIWLSENLKTTKFNDGSDIPLITDLTEWWYLKSPGFCWYNNDTTNKNIYGALYNWYTINSSELCPSGWHVPNKSEWDTLSVFLGGADIAGGYLKDTTLLWYNPNQGATNESGFSALPGGYRTGTGSFGALYDVGFWWNTGQIDEWIVSGKYLRSMDEGIYIFDKGSKQQGLSVRCIMN